MVSLEDGSASIGESHLGLMQTAFHLDETVRECVFPHGVSGAGTTPGFHRLGMGPTTTRNPVQKLKH